MKKIPCFLFFVSVFFLFGCKSAPEENDEYKDIREILATYDIHVLAKIEQNAPPRYIAVFFYDFNDLGPYADDLGKLLHKQILLSGRLGIVEDKKMSALIAEHTLFPLHNEDDFFRLGELSGSDYLIKASVSSSRIDYIAGEKSVNVNLSLNADIFYTSDHSLFRTITSIANIKTDKESDISNSNAALYKAAQAAIKDLIEQLKSTYPAFGFVLRTNGPEYITDLGKNVLARKGMTIAFISQGSIDPKNPEKHLYEFYAAGIIRELDEISSTVIIDDEIRPPGNAIAVLIN